MIPLINFGKISDVPAIMLFESGENRTIVNTMTNEVTPLGLDAKSNFPDFGHVVYKITLPGKSDFSIALRVPVWSTHFTAIVNGDRYNGTPGQYLYIRREWENGDEFKVDFDIPGRIESGGKSYPEKVAIQIGPYIL
jgi:DUF1680 family protein